MIAGTPPSLQYCQHFIQCCKLVNTQGADPFEWSEDVGTQHFLAATAIRLLDTDVLVGLARLDAARFGGLMFTPVHERLRSQFRAVVDPHHRRSAVHLDPLPHDPDDAGARDRHADVARAAQEVERPRAIDRGRRRQPLAQTLRKLPFGPGAARSVPARSTPNITSCNSDDDRAALAGRGIYGSSIATLLTPTQYDAHNFPATLHQGLRSWIEGHPRQHDDSAYRLSVSRRSFTRTSATCRLADGVTAFGTGRL